MTFYAPKKTCHPHRAECKRILLFCLVLCLRNAFVLWAQEKPVIIDQVNVINDAPQGAKGFWYGPTKPWVLKESLYLKEGQTFTTQKKFDDKIRDVRDSLSRNSLFQAGSRVEVLDNPKANQSLARHVIINIYISDSFNFIAYPRASFNSSRGVDVGLRFRHYNPFGFMRQWTGRIGYVFNEHQRSSGDISLEGGIPLNWLNQSWNLTFSTAALIAPWYGSVDNTTKEEVPFTARIGLGTFWKILPSYHSQMGVWTEVYQKIDVIAQNTHASGVAVKYDPYILATGYNVYLKLPIYELPGMGLLYTITGHGGYFGYRLETKATDTRRGYFPFFSHSFNVGEVNLAGNMRQGFSAFAQANFSYDPYRGRKWGIWGQHATFGKDENPWRDSTVSAGVSAYWPLHEYVAVAGRLGWLYYPMDTANTHELGGVLRGIRDGRMRGDMLFYWNADIMFKGWLGRLDSVGEVWLGLFYDGGLTRQPSKKFEKPFHSMGIEVVWYPRFSRNIRIRASLGEDIQAMFANGKLTGASPRDGQSQYELYLGIDLHY